MRFLFLATSLFIFTACDSPMNHRVRQEDSADKKLQSLNLQSLSLGVDVQWLSGPIGNISETNQLMVILKDQSGIPVDLPEGLTLNFYATMPSMGHPMDDAGYFKALGNGIYLNSNIRYNMPGDWKNELWVMDREFNIVDKVAWAEFF